MVSSLQPTIASGEGLTVDMRATLSSAREAMSDLAENTEALKRSFFFRGFFKDRGFYDLDGISLAEYESKEFNKDIQKERAWIQQADLFTVKSDASEDLRPGKKKVDAAMAAFLRFTRQCRNGRRVCRKRINRKAVRALARAGGKCAVPGETIQSECRVRLGSCRWELFDSVITGRGSGRGGARSAEK